MSFPCACNSFSNGCPLARCQREKCPLRELSLTTNRWLAAPTHSTRRSTTSWLPSGHRKTTPSPLLSLTCVDALWQATSLTPTPTTLALPSHTMHAHQKKPALTKFYSLFKLTALCALFHEAAALQVR